MDIKLRLWPLRKACLEPIAYSSKVRHSVAFELMQLGFSSTVFLSSLQEKQKEKSSGSYKILNGDTVLPIDGSDYLMFIPRGYFLFTREFSWVILCGRHNNGPSMMSMS